MTGGEGWGPTKKEGEGIRTDRTGLAYIGFGPINIGFSTFELGLALFLAFV